MKKLGLVGGMGPESTIPYYHDIVYGVQERLGKPLFPPLTVESVDVFTILRLCGEERYEELTAYLLDALNCLARSGADFAALSANTPHIVFDQLQAQSPLPLVSIVDTACAEARRRQFTRLGLLGTRFTMEADFFKAPFRASHITVVTPSAGEMELVHTRVASELELGIVRDSTREEFRRILRRMKEEDGIQAVVLGCTELPLLLNDQVSPVPCLDTMQIHIQALIDAILQ